MSTQVWMGSLLALGLLACGGPKGYVIQGDVTGFPDSTDVYLINVQTNEKMDSTQLIGGRFQMQGVLAEEPMSVRLIIQTEPIVGTSLLMGNERITLQGDKSDFPHKVNLSLSKYDIQDEHVRAVAQSWLIEQDSLVKLLTQMPAAMQRGEEGAMLLRQIRRLSRQHDSMKRAYMFAHPDTYPSLIKLSYDMYSYSRDTVQMLFDQMSPELQASSYAKRIRLFLNTEPVTVGKPFLDFEAEDQIGKPVRLSDFVGKDGKYLLLDFTAAWCGPCIMANKEMRQMTETYSDSLRIVSFSMDNNKETWQNALKRDSVCWTSLWNDQQPLDQSISIPYRVEGFPTFFLISPQGVVEQQWFGYGPGFFEQKIGRLKNQPKK